jgi:hypothetical protein
LKETVENDCYSYHETVGPAIGPKDSVYLAFIFVNAKKIEI